MYVDEALVTLDQVLGIWKTEGLELRKWISIGLSEEHLLSTTFLCLGGKSTIRTLGFPWNVSEDFFYLVIKKKEKGNSYTKSQVLSLTARPFDTAGLLPPIIRTTEIIMQDDEIKPVALHKWKNFNSKYNNVWLYYNF